MRGSRVSVLMFFVAFLWSSVALAATLYVSTSGTNTTYSAAQSSGTPARTLTFIVPLLQCGDTLNVRGGTYTTEASITFNQDCAAGNEITVRAANLGPFPADTMPLISWSNNTNSNNRFFFQDTTGIIIDGLEMTSGWNAARIEKADRITYRRNKIHHFGNSAFETGSNGGCKNCIVDRNAIYANGDFNLSQCGGVPTCNQFHGLYVNGIGWVVTNNLIYDNLGYGFQVHGMQGNDQAIVSGVAHCTLTDDTYCRTTATIINNTFAYSRNRAAITLWNENNDAMVSTIENNIFFENSQSGTENSAINYTSGPWTGTVIQNNVHWATGVTIFTSGTCSGCTVTNNRINLANTNMVNAPSTVPASPDFHLNSGSNAIDFGLDRTSVFTAAGIPVVDYAGTTRSGTWEVGAYVFGSVVNFPPAAPTGVTVR